MKAGKVWSVKFYIYINRSSLHQTDTVDKMF